MAKVWKCNLDNKNVLTGYTEIEDTAAQPGDLVFDTKPDNAPGEYRWNGVAFDPVNLGQNWHTPDGPDSWYAVFRALLYLQKNVPGIDFPAPTKLWMQYYHNSFGRPNDPQP